jgi:hypothetical protein
MCQEKFGVSKLALAKQPRMSILLLVRYSRQPAGIKLWESSDHQGLEVIVPSLGPILPELDQSKWHSKRSSIDQLNHHPIPNFVSNQAGISGWTGTIDIHCTLYSPGCPRRTQFHCLFGRNPQSYFWEGCLVRPDY